MFWEKQYLEVILQNPKELREMLSSIVKWNHNMKIRIYENQDKLIKEFAEYLINFVKINYIGKKLNIALSKGNTP